MPTRHRWAQRLLSWSATGWGLAILAASTVGVAIGLCALGVDLLRFQLTFDAQTFASLTQALGPGGLRRVLWTTWTLDFVFPPLYALALYGLYRSSVAALQAQVHPWVDRALARLPFAAAVLDWIENAGLTWLWSLASGPLSGPAVWLVSAVAALKWFAAALTLLGWLTTVLQSCLGRMLWTCRFGLLSLLLGSLPLVLLPQGRDVLRELVSKGAAPGPQAWAVLAGLLWSTSVWYWSRVLLMLRGKPHGDARGERDENVCERLVEWLPRLLGGLTGLGVAVGFCRAGHGGAAWCAASLTTAFLVLVWKRRALLRALGFVGTPPPTWAVDQPWPALRGAAAAALLLSLICLALFIWVPVPLTQSLGTAAVLFLTMAHAVFVGSLLMYLSRRLRLPLVALALGCAAAFSLWNDAHVMRLQPGSAAPRQAVADELRPWLDVRLKEWRVRHEGKPFPLLLVAAEGGGIRAAYWTAAVLSRLQDREPSFARHLFAVSGVSGGSLGAATFAALLADGPPPVDDAPPAGWQPDRTPWNDMRAYERASARVLSRNFLAPVLAKMVSPDFVQWFVPFPLPALDRSLALEDAWSRAYREVLGRPRGRFEEPFLGLWQGRPAIPPPALLLNAAHVQSGGRLIHSNLRVNSKTFPEARDTIDLLGADLSLAAAVHNSARFTWVSPAGRLRDSHGSDQGHVVDGGYFENSGATSLRDLLEVVFCEYSAEQVRPIVLHLCNDPAACGDPRSPETRPATLGDVLSPVRAVLSAREARGRFAVSDLARDTRVQVLKFAVEWRGDDRQDPAPLGWQLAPTSQCELSMQAACYDSRRLGNCLSGGACEAAGEPPPACPTSSTPCAGAAAPAPR